MCLSTVYEVKDDEQTKICEYVCDIKAEGSRIVITDILGSQRVVFGSLRSLDLVNNKVIIEGIEDGDK